MDSNISPRRRKPGKRVRGYQIRAMFNGGNRFDSGHHWLPQAPYDAWNAIIHDPSVYSATLTRSGRTWLQYSPWREKAMSAPLNQQAGFSLMR